jgi:hypothetical protein
MGIEVTYEEGGKWYSLKVFDIERVKAIRFPDGTIYDFVLAEKGKNPWRMWSYGVKILKELSECGCACNEECERKVVIDRLKKIEEDL